MAATEFTPEELAQSAHALMLRNAAHVGDENTPALEWDALGFNEQAPWRLLAQRAPALLDSLEGATFDVVAFKLFHTIQPPEVPEEQAAETYQQMHKLYQLMWESIARFLHAAFDSEDGDLGEASNVFHDWFKRKADSIPRILLAGS